MPPNQSDQPIDPVRQLALTAESYDSKVRLLFQLENYISLVKYNPLAAKRDKSAEFRRFVTARKLDIWDSLESKSDTRKTHKRLQSTRKEVEDAQIELRRKPRSKPAAPSTKAPTAKDKKKHSTEITSASSAKAAEVAKHARAQKQPSGKAAKRRAPEETERGTPHRKSSGWVIDSDLCLPDQPPSTKRIRYSSNLIMSPIHYVKPTFHGNLDELFSTYRTITDDQEPINEEQWAKRVELDAASLLRVHGARESGLLAELEANGVGSNKQIPKFVPPLPEEPSHYDYLLSQGIHYAKLRSNLRKFHQTIIKRNAQSVEQYFRRLVGAEDRERKELERQVKQIARRTGQEVMKKWKLAQKIVEQRREAALAEEKREKGKEYLNQILDNSAKLIESRMGDADPGLNSTDESSDVDASNDDNESSESDNEVMSDHGNDENLSLEQLREKYRNLPNLESSENDGENESSSDEDESGSEVDESSEPEKPSDEALKLYAEAEEESGEESELDSGSDSDTGSESESESVSEEEGPGLAALLGNAVDDDESSQEEEEEEEQEQEQNQEEVSANSDEEKIDVEKTEIKAASDAQINENGNDHENEINVSEADIKSPGTADSKIKEEIDNTEDRSSRNSASPSVDSDAKSDDSDNESVASGAGDTSLSVAKHKIEPPFLLRGTLREYQRNGLDWLAGLVQSGTNGILADEMGLGKTIQTISLLAWLACEKHIWGPHLIVVPTSVMLNWEMEFKRFAPGFKILTYFGTPQQRKRKRRGWNKEDTWHVCITSYQLVIQDQVVFRGKRWQFMVLDEAHNIKNFRSQRWQALLNFNAQYRLLLTGTPLQNNLVELWSLLYFLMPSTRGTQMMPAGFASLDDFQEWFAKPVDQMVEEGEEADDEARKTIAKLHQVLRPYLLRRLKVDVEKQMPAKYEHVVYCRLSKRQRYLYDDFMSRASTRATLESGNFMSILNCLMQLRKVCNHPDLFEVRPIVTSYAIDHGVYSTYGEFVAPRFSFADIGDIPCSLNFDLLGMENDAKWMALSREQLSANSEIQADIEASEKEIAEMGAVDPDFSSVEGWAKYNLFRRRMNRVELQKRTLGLNFRRTHRVPIYGRDCVTALQIVKTPIKGVRSLLDRELLMKPIVDRYSFVTPPVVILDYPETMFGNSIASRIYSDSKFQTTRNSRLFHEEQVKLSIAFPDKRLLQYDCGKLQKLAIILRDLISAGHRCLIFTQMTKVLDILELFLNLHGWRYLRLDGATRVEQRQTLTERFNKDASIPVFILSTRSGGLGINLTGADTVIFYDSDWNPAMDRQCQDRCHRIGQTRDVHIYRLVSEYTIESNILRKATQKTILDNVVIQEGDFTTEYFTRMSVQDILGNDAGRNTAAPTLEQLESSGPKRLEAAMAQAEDKDDQLAANLALSEARMDQEEFEDVRQSAQAKTQGMNGYSAGSGTALPTPSPQPSSVGTPYDGDTATETNYTVDSDSKELQAEEGDNELEIGHIDDWMIRAIERGDIY